ncbi:SCP-like protein [Ancylostoma ceylanicum]|uniref:SCP-like protein n=1 Tax=Ancylostoma ceylanicum TaxID=53326 RepID=A0A0D6MAR5_9BILA|nr:SCP-like protein [Ancylostoma ceylanicum]
MSKKSRQAVLDWHNDYRSRVAKGEYKIENDDSTLKVLPTAARMPMLKYNCTLENKSLKWAYSVQCSMTHSGPGENLFAIGGHYSVEQIAETAIKVWAEEISQQGLLALDLWAINVGHATQVLWGETESVGCGIIQCDNVETVKERQYTKPERCYQNVAQKEEKKLQMKLQDYVNCCDEENF